jgi:putative SOS response-associated peptidase YedK
MFGKEQKEPVITPAERERWLRRQAMQIAVQLPEDEAEALQVLDYAKALLRPF